MMWAKRRFKYAEFAPYQDILGELQMANAKICGQFIMVSVDTKDEPGESEYYVGVPNKAFLMPFVGFQQIQESECLEKSTRCCSRMWRRRNFKGGSRLRRDRLC